MAGQEGISLVVQVIIGIAFLSLGISILLLTGVIDFRIDMDKYSNTDFEVRDCETFLYVGSGMKAAWENAEDGLSKIRFCTSYQRCVIGCAMLVTLVDTAVAGNMTQGIYSINNRLEVPFGVNIDPDSFDFNRIMEDAFIEINQISEIVKEATLHMDIVGGGE